jgi:2-haloacid dehalogenase
MFGYMKPRIEFFKAIEQRYSDYELGDYLIIGDSLKSDVGFGQAAGIDSCWFNQSDDELPNNYRPTYIIRHLGELKSLL